MYQMVNLLCFMKGAQVFLKSKRTTLGTVEALVVVDFTQGCTTTLHADHWFGAVGTVT